MVSIRNGLIAAGAGLFVLNAVLVFGQQNVETDHIVALQRRLADAGCYRGPINGQDSADLQSAIKACPSQEPVLLIETGMHLAPIKQIGVNRACSMAATGSDDKTVRVWSLPDGHLLRTLRVPIGPGNGGKVFAVAVSPDGRRIAAGGWDAEVDIDHENYVYVFDSSTGAMIARVGPFGNVINHLAFSSDGMWLAATSHADVGLKVIATQSWRIAVEDKNYAGDSYSVAFAPDGRLYTIAFDGKLRRYGPPPHFKKERETATKASKEPFSVAVDPDGKLVAVGFNNTQGVEIYSASTLAYRFGGDIKGFDNGDLSKVVWSGDGARLVAGGAFESLNQGAWKRPLVTFGRDGKRHGALLPLSDNTIQNLQPCGDAMVVAAADPAFGLVDGRGQISLWKTGVAPDFRGKLGEAFAIAPNAKRIRVGLGEDANDPVLFDFDQLTLTGAPNPVPGLMKPVIEGLPIANWKNDFHPTLAGRPIATDRYAMSRSLAIRPDRSGFVLGADFNLRAFDAEGRQLWQRPNPAAAWGVNISADGRIIVVAYRDGTIRWHRWSDGRELLALFINRKTKTWVAWTPSGYYLASPGGETLIGWLVNRGWNQPADFFPASQFANKYARQDIVNRVLDTLDEQEAVRLADRSNSANKVVAPIIETLPPVLSILSPADNTHVAGTSVTVTYIVRSPSGVRLDTVGVLINDQPSGARSTGDDTEVKRCIEETHGLGRAEGALQGCRGSLTVEISPGSTEIGVFAKAGGKTSTMATTRVTR